MAGSKWEPMPRCYRNDDRRYVSFSPAKSGKKRLPSQSPTRGKRAKSQTPDTDKFSDPENLVVDSLQNEITCLTLDLWDGFLNELESFPENTRYHKSLEDWVLIFLNINTDKIEDISLKRKLSEELLVAIGFKKASDAINTILKRSKLMPSDHVDPIDAVKRFIIDEYKYNPVPNLTETHAIPTSWLDLVDLSNFGQVVNVSGLSLSEEGKIIEDPRLRNQFTIKRLQYFDLLTSKSPLHTMLFHGTDVDSVENICKNGIDVNRGCQKRDFSDGAGFYLTKSYEDAECWAFSQTQAPAVLGFNIPNKCLEKAKKLDVTDESMQSEWLEIVTHNRSGKSTQKTSDHDFIEGPISELTEGTTEGTTEGQQIRKAKTGSYQLCIVSDDYADEISECSKIITLYGDQ